MNISLFFMYIFVYASLLFVYSFLQYPCMSFCPSAVTHSTVKCDRANLFIITILLSFSSVFKCVIFIITTNDTRLSMDLTKLSL